MASYQKPRTRATTWVPRRVYYVLRHLQRSLTAGTAQAISNKQIQIAVKFGSEGEVSQIMRWLAGETPTMGRWAAGYLQANAQTYRFITRERLPSGGYSVTLLGTPERIDAPVIRLPEIVQLSFFGADNDPSMIPHAGQQDAAQGGSFLHDPFSEADPQQSKAAHVGSAGDQHEESPKEIQEEEGHTPLFDRLLREPGMNRRYAQQVVTHAIGSLTDFEADLRLAQADPSLRRPLFVVTQRWLSGQRFTQAEEPRHVNPTRTRTRTRPDAAARQPDAAGAALPERGPVRTQLIY